MLDTINTILTDTLGPFGPLLAVGILGLFLVLITLPVLMKREVDPLDKIKAARTATPKSTEKAQKLRTDGKRDKLERYANFLEPQNTEEFSAIRMKLMQAGYRTKNAVRFYHFSQFALGILGLLLGGLWVILKLSTGQELTSQTMAIAVLGPGIAGYLMPKYWVTRRQQGRQEEITCGFPDALDMMLVCVEAGQSLDQSIIRVSKEIRAGYPALADEFEMVANEIKAGKEKSTVLRDMAERTGVSDVASFTTVLIQSQQFGTSIADALRVYASEMRDKRVMRAEEAANKLPTKMTLATMMLTVPPLLIILIGPSVYDIGQTLAQVSGR
jgi:tight adherence protein C